MKLASTVRIPLVAILLVVGCASDERHSIIEREPDLDPDLAVDISTLRCTTPSTACKPIESVIDSFGSTYDVDSRLAGAWQFCGGADDRGRFGAGLELTLERELYVLEPAADGSCRRTTEAPAADWYTFDISEQNPWGTYQLVLAWRADGSTTSLVPKFSSRTSGLIDGFAGFEFGKLGQH